VFAKLGPIDRRIAKSGAVLFIAGIFFFVFGALAK
jgi:hypothetical protein